MDKKRSRQDALISVEEQQTSKSLKLDDKVKVPTVINVAPGSSYIDCGHFRLVSGVWGEKGVRKAMEDAHLICHSIFDHCGGRVPGFAKSMDAALFGVFDGHGGRQTANFVRENLPTEVATATVTELNSNDAVTDNVELTDKHIKKILKKAFVALDIRIANELPNCKDGSTAVVVYFPFSQSSPLKLYIGGVGDAAARLGRLKSSDGQLQSVPLTEAHKPWSIKEKERIIKSGGTVESGRVNGIVEISRSFGDLQLKKYGLIVTPTILKFAIDPLQDEFVLVGCDGLWANWSGENAVNKTRDLIKKEHMRLLSQNAVIEELDPKIICQQLVEHVIVDRKSQDNVSALLIQFQKIV